MWLARRVAPAVFAWSMQLPSGAMVEESPLWIAILHLHAPGVFFKQFY
jgi:hypothetical protein